MIERAGQFFVIMLFAFFGEIMANAIPLPIAGPIYGMILLLSALIAGMPLKYVDKAADFMLGILALFFIAPAVGVIEIWNDIRQIWPFLAAILVMTFLAVMLSTGYAAEIFLKRKGGRK